MYTMVIENPLFSVHLGINLVPAHKLRFGDIVSASERICFTRCQLRI